MTALGTLIIAFVVDVVDGTTVNVAVPAIRSDLHAGALAVQWIVALMPVFAADGPAIPLVLALLMAGLGMAMLAGPLTPIALARIDRAHAGAAGGVLKAVQQLGSAIGAALAVFRRRTARP